MGLCLLWTGTAAAAAPANDDFAAAEPLSGASVGAGGTTAEATSEPGEPRHGGDSLGTSVWYRWRPARSGMVSLSCESGFETRVAVYAGSTLAGLSEVVSYRGDLCGWPPVRFRAAAGLEYRIAVDSAGGGGPFTFALQDESTPPPNDDFAAATPFTDRGRNDYAPGTTEGAGREPGEPFHGGWPFGASIWFRWTAQYDGAARIYACSGSFHPVIAVYAGGALGALTPVGAPTPPGVDARGCTLAGGTAIALDAVAGQSYAVAVDGAAGAWGNVTVEAIDAPLPPIGSHARIGRRIRIRRGRANIRFYGSYYESTFECRLDRRPFRACESPIVYRHLRRGRHRFAVKAIGQPGSAPSPAAVRHFRIRRRSR